MGSGCVGPLKGARGFSYSRGRRAGRNRRQKRPVYFVQSVKSAGNDG